MSSRAVHLLSHKEHSRHCGCLDLPGNDFCCDIDCPHCYVTDTTGITMVNTPRRTPLTDAIAARDASEDRLQTLDILTGLHGEQLDILHERVRVLERRLLTTFFFSSVVAVCASIIAISLAISSTP